MKSFVYCHGRECILGNVCKRHVDMMKLGQNALFDCYVDEPFKEVGLCDAFIEVKNEQTAS